MRRAALAALALATLGVVLSLVLERLHVLAYLSPAQESFCTLDATVDCSAVALSHWSVLLGVPVPLWGALGFFAIGMAIITESRWFLPLAATAALASLGLLALEIFVIGAICLLCEAVHLVSFVLFGLALALRRAFRKPFGARKPLLAAIVAPAAVFVGLAAWLPHYWGAFGWYEPPPFPHGKTSEGHPWIGSNSPRITVEEYTDYRCPHCRVAAARSLRRLSEHPQSLRIVRRQFPRGRCPKRPNIGCIQIRMAYCAEEQGKFWQADRWLFEHGGPSDRNSIPSFAEDLGLDASGLEACLARTDPAVRAADEARAALDMKLTTTPTLIVNGKRMSEAEFDGLLAGMP